MQMLPWFPAGFSRVSHSSHSTGRSMSKYVGVSRGGGTRVIGEYRNMAADVADLLIIVRHSPTRYHAEFGCSRSNRVGGTK